MMLSNTFPQLLSNNSTDPLDTFKIQALPHLPWVQGASVASATKTLAETDHARFLLDANLRWGANLDKMQAAGGVGWGRNPRNEPLRSACLKAGLPFLYLEDPYFRSWGLAKQRHASPPVGMMLDARQPAYDCTGSGSEAEARIKQRIADPADNPGDGIMNFIVSSRLTKYNLPHVPGGSADRSRMRIGVVDQVGADRSLVFGGAGKEASNLLCRHAIDRARNEQALLVIRTHPDVRAGKSGPALSREIQESCERQGVAFAFSDTESAHDFLDSVDEVLTLTSGLGFEALLKGVTVTTFGAPFYAGWGLTDDLGCESDAVQALERRGAELDTRRIGDAESRRRLNVIVTTMLEEFTLWWDPVRRQRCDAMQALRRLVSWRSMEAVHGQPARIYGVASWKRPAVTAMVAAPGADIRYSIRVAPSNPSQGRNTFVWGNPSKVKNLADVTRIEDGFIRSVGLGANFVRPASLVFDPVGLHYSADRPSLIENILQAGNTLTGPIAERAHKLRLRIVASGIDKYNLSNSGGPPPGIRGLHLVVGQVVDDESVRQGMVTALPGDPLVRLVRSRVQTAKIGYRPHPDVVANLRNGDKSSSAADIDASGGKLSSWFAAADRVHVATSLAGFEALIHGVPVSTYGMPFYAGWGLTDDQTRNPRRTRTITLDELVAAALILYPRYVSLVSGLRCEPEDVLDEIEAIGAGAIKPPVSFGPRTSLLMKLVVGAAKRTGLRL